MRRILALAILVVAACGGDDNQNHPDAPTNPMVDAGVTPDGNTTVTEVQCETLAPVTTGTCGVTPGTGGSTLLKGNVLTPSTVYIGGQVLVDATGMISCTGCSCGTATDATVISCPGASISPGLINTHDHITFTQDPPYMDTGERYDSRQQWRLGLDGHKKIPAPGGATAAQVSWGELRFLMGGATSTVGSGGQAGLLRNLDKNLMEGLAKTPVKFDTFPLGDSSGTRNIGNCNYGTGTTAASLSAVTAYEPHTSEGVDSYAHNEFLCESSMTYDTMAPGVSQDLAIGKTAMIHGIGLTAEDYGLMAANHTSLIWSPRSNITLYGDTARVSTAARLGVQIALGTDWLPSGSMNMLRELTCADGFNSTYLNHFFTDEQLWAMTTVNAANVTATGDVLGTLAMGRTADIAVFAGHGKGAFRTVIEAQPADVALVMRGGKILYGDAASVGTMLTGCDTLDVCGTSKEVCLMSEVGMNLAALTTAAKNIYPAFSCTTPVNEPSCSPKRPAAVSGSTIYTGVASADDTDGDGVPNAMDNCPTVFNPIRPMDGGKQNDTDGDGVGDECDPCPRDANSTSCTAFDPNDSDGDGHPNDMDNCPNVPNPDQLDSDGDGKGDACDACPMIANMGAAACPATIYQVKTSSLPLHAVVAIQHALVTGAGTNGFFIQVKETDTGYTGADNSGLFVFTGTGSALLGNATVGARVTVTGSTDVFQGEIELTSVTDVTVEAVGPEAAPAPIATTYAEIKTGGTRAATLEGVLVQVGASTISAVTAPEFTLTDASANSLVVGNFLFTTPNPAVNQAVVGATGILAFRQMADKLLPRSAADLNLGPPILASFAPALSFVRQGVASTTFPAGSELTVTLTGPAQGDTTITVTSMDANVSVVGPVVVLNGTTSVKVTLLATAQVADATLLAVLGSAMMTAHVRALGTTETPSTVTLTPATTTVAPGGTRTFTVALDIPAPAAGTVVTLAATSGTVAGSVTVPANTLSAPVTYTAAASGTATLTATLGGSTSTATITIGIDHLIINEVDYDQVGTDGAEFVEIYNPSASDADLTGVALVLVNGSNNTTYQTVDLSSAGTLPAGGYLVVGGAGVTVAAPALKVDPGWTTNAVQNGSPDGLALINTNGPVLLDALSYSNTTVGITSVNITGFPAPVSLVEGTLETAKDSNTAAGSLCRTPNGSDTDQANTDWKFCTAPTPGTANGN